MICESIIRDTGEGKGGGTAAKLNPGFSVDLYRNALAIRLRRTKQDQNGFFRFQ